MKECMIILLVIFSLILGVYLMFGIGTATLTYELLECRSPKSSWLSPRQIKFLIAILCGFFWPLLLLNLETIFSDWGDVHFREGP